MNKIFTLNKQYPYALYVLLGIAMFFSNTSFCQQRTSLKKTVSKQASKRVIYGLASFYHNKFNGRRTASGEIFSQDKLTCACNMLPIGTWVKITNIRNGKTVVVKVNDRLHPKMRRVADLSRSAAKKLGYTAQGLVRVKVEVISKK